MDHGRMHTKYTCIYMARSHAFYRKRRLDFVVSASCGSSSPSLLKQRLCLWVARGAPCDTVYLPPLSQQKTRHQVPLEDRLAVLHICDLRDLAVALVEKCTVDPDADEYSGEDGQPWNVEPVFSVRRRSI